MSQAGEPLRLGAVVLAGGTAARMDGADKAVIELDGVTLLERSLAGIDRFLHPPDMVAVVAVDMPRLHAGTVARLTWAVEADPGVDGAVLVDADGRRQTLAGVYRLSALTMARPASPEDEHGLPVRRLVGGLRLAEVPAVGDEARDVDTWEDLRDLRQ